MSRCSAVSSAENLSSNDECWVALNRVLLCFAPLRRSSRTPFPIDCHHGPARRRLHPLRSCPVRFQVGRAVAAALIHGRALFAPPAGERERERKREREKERKKVGSRYVVSRKASLVLFALVNDCIHSLLCDRRSAQGQPINFRLGEPGISLDGNIRVSKREGRSERMNSLAH